MFGLVWYVYFNRFLGGMKGGEREMSLASDGV